MFNILQQHGGLRRAVMFTTHVIVQLFVWNHIVCTATVQMCNLLSWNPEKDLFIYVTLLRQHFDYAACFRFICSFYKNKQTKSKWKNQKNPNLFYLLPPMLSVRGASPSHSCHKCSVSCLPSDCISVSMYSAPLIVCNHFFVSGALTHTSLHATSAVPPVPHHQISCCPLRHWTALASHLKGLLSQWKGQAFYAWQLAYLYTVMQMFPHWYCFVT